MGTRSVIAISEGDGWRGRYVHWDGYPSHMVPSYRAIVERDGLVAATKVLTQEHRGWSGIDHLQGDVVSEDYANLYPPERFRSVPGYGVAYTDAEQPDEWIVPDGDSWGTEWAYVLSEVSLTVYEYLWRTAGDRRNRWRLVDSVRWDQEVPPRLLGL